MDRSLNEAVTDKIRKYHTDYNNNPPNATSFMSVVGSTSGRLHSEFVILLFYRIIGKLTVFLQFQEFSLCNPTVTTSTATTRCSPQSSNQNTTSSLSRWKFYYVTYNSKFRRRTYSFTIHSQTSRLLTSSLSLGVPVPRATVYTSHVDLSSLVQSFITPTLIYKSLISFYRFIINKQKFQSDMSLQSEMSLCVTSHSRMTCHSV